MRASRDLRDHPFGPGGSAEDLPQQRGRSTGNPAWVQTATAAIVVYLVGWALAELMPNPRLRALGAVVRPWTTTIGAGLGLAAVGLLVFWFPAWMRMRKVRSMDGALAEEAAVADEFKIRPATRVSVDVRVWPYWRYPFWLLRRATVWLPRGWVPGEPASQVCQRLEPLLGPTRQRSWKPRRGRLVLVRATDQDPGEVHLPEVQVDPQKRAVQAMEGLLKTDQLRPEPVEHNEQGEVTTFKVRHPPNHRLGKPDAQRSFAEALEPMLPPAPGERGWEVTEHAQNDYTLITARTPMPTFLPHPVLDYASEFSGARLLPFGWGASAHWMGWDISPSTQCPHCLLVGPTGAGKTNTIRSIIVGATLGYQIEVWGLDPKMIELMGCDGWPGVTRLAVTVEEMANLIDAAHAEMMDRYTRIRRHELHPAALPPLVVILDEFFILRAQLMRWWKEDLRQKGQPPHLAQLNEMLALARSAGIYLCLGIQRPDATHFDDGARDNMRTRVAHSELAQEARTMMWGHPSLGILASQGVRGRVMASGASGDPEETQQFWTPDLDQHPLAREHMSGEDRALIDALRPADFQPYSITKDGLVVPNTDSREIPAGSSQAELMDEDGEMVRARDLTPGDRIKYERDEGERWESAVVEANTYKTGDDTLDLEIVWDHGGGGQTLGGLDPAEDIYTTNQAHSPA